MLNPGSPAPPFTLPDADGNIVSLSDYRGQKVVIAFYPKDNSPVCTVQMKQYRDSYPEFEKRNTVIIGISNDTVESHAKFRKDCDLPFPILADMEKEVSRKYEVLSYFNALQRSVYIIAADGVITYATKTLPLFYTPAKELLELL